MYLFFLQRGKNTGRARAPSRAARDLLPALFLGFLLSSSSLCEERGVAQLPAVSGFGKERGSSFDFRAGIA